MGDEIVTVAKKFYLQPPAKKQIQDVGLRALIISNMTEAGFKSGNAKNIDDGRVVVAIGSDSLEKIESFRKELCKKLESESEKEYSLVPSGITCSELKELDNPAPIILRPLNELSSSLMLEQTSRGVGAMTKGFKGVKEGIGGMNELLTKILKAIEKKP